MPKLDVGIAVVAAVVTVLGTSAAAAVQDGARRLDVCAVALVVLAGLALAWRRRAPVAVLSAVLGLAAVYLLAGYPYGPIQLCMLLAMFEVARQRAIRTSLLACAVAVAAFGASTFVRALLPAQHPALLFAVWASWLVVPWSVGALIQARAVATLRARHELMARAALEERLRVAQEVHDVAGHGLAAVAMQAGVALVVFDEQPEQAKESLQAIQVTSTRALTELRAMLDAVQRSTSSPGLRDVPELVENVRAAGLPVTLGLESVAVRQSVDLAAFRVVQEALTNVLRHAGPTTAEVLVFREQDALVVQVLDRGIGCETPQPGRGLEGMRSRVAAVGGELAVAPRSGGGFRVHARMPILEELP